MPSISWQSFRHTHATLFINLGESLKTAQAQLGHARLSTIAEIYTHVVPASQRAAVERLERAVSPQLDPSWKDSRSPVVNSSSDVTEVKGCAQRNDFRTFLGEFVIQAAQRRFRRTELGICIGQSFGYRWKVSLVQIKAKGQFRLSMETIPCGSLYFDVPLSITSE